MNNPIMDIAKFLGQIVGAAVTVLLGLAKWLGDRQARFNRKTDEKLIAIDKTMAEEFARLKEDVKRLRENVEQNREDMKEGLDRITDRMFNRPR